MTWDHVEVNPFVKSSGTLVSIIKNVLDGLKYSIEKISKTPGTIKIYNESILHLNPQRKFKVIITDPPIMTMFPMENSVKSFTFGIDV